MFGLYNTSLKSGGYKQHVYGPELSSVNLQHPFPRSPVEKAFDPSWQHLTGTYSSSPSAGMNTFVSHSQQAISSSTHVLHSSHQNCSQHCSDPGA